MDEEEPGLLQSVMDYLNLMIYCLLTELRKKVADSESALLFMGNLRKGESLFVLSNEELLNVAKSE